MKSVLAPISRETITPSSESIIYNPSTSVATRDPPAIITAT